MKINKTNIKFPSDRRKVNRIYWIITIAVILAPFIFLVYKTMRPPVNIEIKSSYDGYITKIEKKNIIIKSPLLEEKFKMLQDELANLNDSDYARKIKDAEISVKLTKEYNQKTLELKTKGLSTMSQVLYTNEKYNYALVQYRESVKDYNTVKREINHEIAQTELRIKALDIKLPEKFKVTAAVGSYVTKGQTIAIN
jgi:hypothetical protein